MKSINLLGSEHEELVTDALAMDGSAAPLVDALLKSSAAMWNETTLEKLVRRFASLLGAEFHVTRLGYFEVRGRGAALSLAPANFDLKGASGFGEATIREIEAQLRIVNLQSQEHREGVNSLVLGSSLIEFAMIGEPSAVWSILVWEVSGAGEDRSHALASEKRAVLEFLARQVQHSCKWIGRFDKTQALLHRDDLTGLYNARYLDVALEAEIRRVLRYKTSFSLLFIDLDDFKPINDEHGHLAGSSVLRQVAEVLKDGLREVDCVIRYGGDEFIVLLLETSSTTAAMAAERLRRKIEKSRFRLEGGAEVSLTCSIGVASCPENGIKKDVLLGLADQCMYKSKRGGKNRVVVIGRDEDSGAEAMKSSMGTRKG